MSEVTAIVDFYSTLVSHFPATVEDVEGAEVHTLEEASYTIILAKNKLGETYKENILALLKSFWRIFFFAL
uniref:Uncharacterized protein n=1 Tax=Globodera rostochiensis TaxID=31243 RepID=A0A914GQI4_GLORO